MSEKNTSCQQLHGCALCTTLKITFTPKLIADVSDIYHISVSPKLIKEAMHFH